MQKIPHKWRSLPIKSKLNIPLKYFHFDETEIKRIREISDIKKKLIESAKLQYETFKDIHTDLTAWIAGYSSDETIRRVFNSSRNLRELFVKSSICNENILPSWHDLKKNIKIPENMNLELAEETGVHIGDGNLYSSIKKNKQVYRYSVSGDLTNDFLFHTIYLKDLMKKLYNCEGFFIIRKDKNNIDSIYKSKAILQFKNRILNLPIGNKNNIEMPKQIFESEEFEKRCLIGLIDTDFNITSSMAITGKLNSIKLVKQICRILNKNNIKHTCQIYDSYGRFYINQIGARKIIEEWKLKNPKHISKCQIWTEFKKFLPFTTTTERIAVLENRLQFEDLEKISKKRAPVRTLV